MMKGKDMNSSENFSSCKKLSRRGFISAVAAGTASVLHLTTKKSFAGQSQKKFTDSLNRNVIISSIIEGIVPLGLPAQILITTLCPDKLATLAKDVPNEDKSDYKDSDAACTINLSQTGAISDSIDEEVSTEKIFKTQAGILLDAGTYSEGLSEKLDALQDEAQIPAIFIDLSYGKLPNAYRTLGTLLGCEDRAELLASWIEDTQKKALAISTQQEAKFVFYAPKENGVLLKGNIDVQLDVIKALGCSAVTAPYDYSNKSVSINELKSNQVDFIVFDDASVFSSITSKEGSAYEIWKDVQAIQECRYAASPAIMHSWFGSIIFAQSIGMLWLAAVMWPKECNYSFEEEALEFYGLFYGLDKSSSDINSLPGIIAR